MSIETIHVPSLDAFRADNLISDVIGVVKSGKEATVYCCKAQPSTGAKLLAAKVYRSREGRSFKNDAVYQQGRVIVDARSRRAFRKKTAHGRRVQSGGWVASEAETLNLLHDAGADVPRLVAQSGSAILMEYIGDEESAAPMLKNASLEPDRARAAFDAVMRNVELFLSCDRIHADLSAFNILYWEGAVKIIDFPQAVDPFLNPSAFSLLARDIENVCAYFARTGVRANASRLAADLWRRFMRRELRNRN